MRFIDQFKDLMIIIPLVAALLSFIIQGTEGMTDAIIILAVVVLNAIFGVYQEGRAEAAIEALGRGASIRGEALTLEEFAKLADFLYDCR
mgnify:CR=1 FL=1